MMQPTLIDLVKNSQRIHVVSHLNPDYDAYASLTFMFAILTKNFPELSITMSLETDQPNEVVKYLPGFEHIKFDSLENLVRLTNPDLLIITDAPSLKRVSNSPEVVTSLLGDCKRAIFDHHEVEDRDVDLLENSERYATVEVIYSYCVKAGLTIPEKWEVFYLTGFIGDSYRFYYQYPNYRESFETIATILDHGYTIREYSDRLYGYSKDDLVIFKLFFSHLSIREGYLFTYITWDEFHSLIEDKISESAYKKARRYFIDEIMVKTYDFDFAVFIVPDDRFNDNKTYNGSIRSKSGETLDCTVIAKQLGGGGHTTGSGFTVTAASIADAQTQVFNTIQQFESEARQIASANKKG